MRISGVFDLWLKWEIQFVLQTFLTTMFIKTMNPSFHFFSTIFSCMWMRNFQTIIQFGCRFVHGIAHGTCGVGISLILQRKPFEYYQYYPRILSSGQKIKEIKILFCVVSNLSMSNAEIFQFLSLFLVSLWFLVSAPCSWKFFSVPFSEILTDTPVFGEYAKIEKSTRFK